MRLWDLLRRVQTGIGPITITRHWSSTGYTNMRNVGKLIQVILRAYERPEFKPQIRADGKVEVTHCNEAVRDIMGHFEYHAFAGLSADEMITVMRTSDDWMKKDMADCQSLANLGTIVVAGLTSKELNAAHGHVCIVRPGESFYSTKWQAEAPAVMNVGGQNFILHFKMSSGETIEAGVNGAFQEPPAFYAFVTTL